MPQQPEPLRALALLIAPWVLISPERKIRGLVSTRNYAGIAIVGGGPGGLALARLLQMRGFWVQVLEKDSSPDARSQGGTLDLHHDSGQVAIEAMQLQREFARLSRPEGQATRILDKTGRVLLDEQPGPDELFRPEIDRSDLRKLLLGSLAPDTVTWNAHVSSIEPCEGGRWRLVHGEGVSHEYDLVVGCDGAWSRIRRALSLEEPVYSGITSIESDIRFADRTVPELSKRIGPGSLFALGDGKVLSAQRGSSGNIRVSAGFAVDQDWLSRCGIDFTLPEVARAALRDEFAGWAEEWVKIWGAVDGPFTPRLYYRLSPEHRWQTHDGITLLGDAAHLMTPFGGQGANLAMLDAVDLADCLCDTSFATRTDSLRAFEDKMCRRSSDAAGQTQKNQDLFFGPNAAERLAELLQNHT